MNTGFFGQKKISASNLVSGHQGKFDSSAFISAVATQSDGKSIVGGQFTNYDGVSSRNNLVRLNADGTTDTDFCENAVDGNKFNTKVECITVQPDGKILVGWSFTEYNSISGMNCLVRLNSDGTLDTDFCNNAVVSNKFNFGTIYSISIQADDSILVGGDFIDYGGTTNRNYLVRFDSDGNLDTTFCNNASDSAKFSALVRASAIQADGSILIGGNFINYTLSGRNYFVRLNSDGTIDATFTNTASGGGKFTGQIYTIAVQADTNILVGGDFSSYNGSGNIRFLIRIDSDGILDTGFVNNAVSPSKFSHRVLSIVLQSDGKILVGGRFLNHASASGRSYLLRLNTDGTTDTSFCTAAVDNKFNNDVLSVVVQSSGRIIVGGLFTTYAGTPSRNVVVGINANGTTDTAFCQQVTDPVNYLSGIKFNNTVYSFTTQPDGKILVAGAFTNYGGVSGRNSLIRLNKDFSLDTDFCIAAVDGGKFNGTIRSIAYQSSKILVAGNFTNYASTGVGRDRLIRLNLDGTTDATFCNNASDGSKFGAQINSIATQVTGGIIVGGNFVNYLTANRNRLIRLDNNGSLDAIFAGNASDGNKFTAAVNVVKVLSDEEVLVGGNFTNYLTANRNYFVRLSTNGSVVGSYTNNSSGGAKFNAPVNTIAISFSDTAFVGGQFTDYGGTINRNRFIKLQTNGAVDAPYCGFSSDSGRFNSAVESIYAYGGNAFVGGAFLNYAGTASRDKFIRLDDDGLVDSTFCVNSTDGSKFSGTPNGIFLTPDNKLLVGGLFTNTGLGLTSPSSYFVSLYLDGITY